MPRKKKKAEPEGPQRCLADGCNNPVFPGMEFCAIHGLVDMAVSGAEKAFKKGNVLQGFLSSAAAVVIDRGGPMVQPAVMGAAQRFSQPQSPPPPPPRQQPKADPWAILGLDKTRATAEDVKAAQKHFAQFYHPDKGRAVSPEAIKTINAAAEACLKDLKARK